MCLTFLGIEFDTVNLQIRLPPEKLSNLQAGLTHAVSRKCITKKSLQSLTGLLQHATKVIRPGRAFLKRLYALQSVGSSTSHHIRLSLGARGIYYGGMSLLVVGMVSPYCGIVLESPQRSFVVSDASGSWGCGAFCLPHWFNLQWSANMQDVPYCCQRIVSRGDCCCHLWQSMVRNTGAL